MIVDNLDRVNYKLDKVEKKFDETSFAMEMLQELKKSSQRKFIIIIILIIAFVTTNTGWLLYNAQFETVTEEETEQHIIQEQTDTENSTMSGVIN